MKPAFCLMMNFHQPFSKVRSHSVFTLTSLGETENHFSGMQF